RPLLLFGDSVLVGDPGPFGIPGLFGDLVLGLGLGLGLELVVLAGGDGQATAAVELRLIVGPRVVLLAAGAVAGRATLELAKAEADAAAHLVGVEHQHR